MRDDASGSALRFGLIVAACAVVLAFLAVHRVLLEPGIIGLYHDWTIPPDAGQITVYAKELYRGWHAWGLGAPLDYPTEYPYWFVAAALASLGLGGAFLSKLVVFCAPALAFAAAAILARTLGLGTFPALLSGAVYALSPVMLNKLVAGQVTYLFAYALLPLVPALVIATQRAQWWLCGGMALGALVALVSMQIQLGLIALMVAVAAAAVCIRTSLRGRAIMLTVACAVLIGAEAPTIVAVFFNHAGTSAVLAATLYRKLGWVAFNSIPPLDALRLIGYATSYDRAALGRWYELWSVVAYAVAACALCGIVFAQAPVRWFAAVMGGSALAIMTGVYSPFSRGLIWAFSTIPLSGVFRELYHLMAVMALLYAAGVGLFAQWMASRGFRWAGAALAVLVALFIAPLFSGDCGGQLAAHPYDREMSAAYRRVEGSPGRVAWFPLDQPLAYDGAGAGGEPMAISPHGSLWSYTLAWPLSAVNMYARASDWDEAVRAMGMLSVGDVVDRRDFESKLWDYVFGGPTLHYYLERRLQIPRLSPEAVAVSRSVTIYPVAGKPFAYASPAAAIVPRRMSAVAALWRSGLAPLSYAAAVPQSLPYVVVRDPEDAADEMLTGSGDLTITVQSTEANASFAPLNDWWFLHPALADVAGGVLAFGTQYLQIPIDRPLTDGAIEVSWIATPLGGRVRVEAAGKRFVADTQATPAQWQSAILRAGRLPRGSLVSLTTMDPHGVVAIRTIRAVEASELRQRRARYDDLLRHAKDVFAWRPLRAGIWKTVRTGRSLELGPCSSAFDYRLRARYAASGDDELLVVGPKNAIIGFGRLRARGHDAAATFNGVDAALHLQTKDSRVLDWVLQERPTVRLGAVATRGFLLPTGDVRAGTFDGIRARLPDAGRVAVLNVGFGNNWVPSRNGARHVETALGTNAWIFPNGAKGPLAIDDVYVPPFHEAFSLGTFALLGGLAVPAGLVFLQRRKR